MKCTQDTVLHLLDNTPKVHLLSVHIRFLHSACVDNRYIIFTTAVYIV